MAGSQKWSVESKEFKLLIKEGITGAKIFERNKRNQRSILLLKEELAWLACIGEKLAAVESSEVFWDQSRAGYPRKIAQKCSNQHGCFLTIEKFDGRRRSGSIMVPDGQYGQGWSRFISEVRWANSSISGKKGVSECKKVLSRLVGEAMRRWRVWRVQKCVKSFPEPIVRILKWSKWLKEASTELDLQNCVWFAI